MMVRVRDVKDSGDGGGQESSKVKGINGGGVRSLNGACMADVVAIVLLLLLLFVVMVELLLIIRLCNKFQIENCIIIQIYKCM